MPIQSTWRHAGLVAGWLPLLTLLLVAAACSPSEETTSAAGKAIYGTAEAPPAAPSPRGQPPSPPLPDLALMPPATALSVLAHVQALDQEEALPLRRRATARRVHEAGMASWYGPNFAGRPTASGEIFDPQAMTAAHPDLPLGSEVVVVNVENGRALALTINDRGPFIDDRVIDVSQAAAQKLGFYYSGLAPVRIELPESEPNAAVQTALNDSG